MKCPYCGNRMRFWQLKNGIVKAKCNNFECQFTINNFTLYKSYIEKADCRK